MSVLSGVENAQLKEEAALWSDFRANGNVVARERLFSRHAALLAILRAAITANILAAIST